MNFLHKFVGITKPVQRSEAYKMYSLCFTLAQIQYNECLPGSEEEEECERLMRWLSDRLGENL